VNLKSFPTLKTNSVAQYPATRQIEFQNQIFRFLDGNEQRYRDSAGPLRSWRIQLDRLDEWELAQVDMFFAAAEGQLNDFSFTDPWDGTEYGSCSLAEDLLTITSLADMRGQTSLTVVENRSIQ